MATTTTTTRKGTYQMLWDCPVCGTRKLLGVDHRHCPNCGAPQEENLRYFPSRADRVPTRFTGSEPDWECEHCGAPNGSKAGYCAACGAPRGGARDVHVRASIDASAGETGEEAARDWAGREAERRAAQLARAGGGVRGQGDGWYAHLMAWRRLNPTSFRWSALGAGALVMTLLIIWLVRGRAVEVEVTGHSWTRTIPVERYTTVSESAWCDSLPGGARVRSRSREIHHYNRIPDGEDCRTVPGSCSNSCRNVDNGNGSFSEVCTQSCSSDRTECTTRYREEPVYADRCRYDIDRWIAVREAVSQGAGLSAEWPADPSHSSCTSTRLGCERLGTRFGEYVIHFVTEPGRRGVERWDCPFPEAKWRSIRLGSRWSGRVSRVRGQLRCEDLTPAR